MMPKLPDCISRRRKQGTRSPWQISPGCTRAAGEVQENDALAVDWYRKAADAGNAVAMTELGAMYARGEGVAQDGAEAIRWYRNAADAGDAVAMTTLRPGV